MTISNASMSRQRTRPTSLLFWKIKQHIYFSWKTHLHIAMAAEYCKGLSRGIRLMKLQNDAYTAPDVQDNTDVPNIFENHHVNDAGEKIACHAVDIQELIKKKPTFEDVEDE